MPRLVSTMQPAITDMSWARAAATMRIASRKPSHVCRHDARLVGDDGQRRSLANEAKPIDVVRSNRLLDDLDVIVEQDVDHVERVLRCPRSVCIDTQDLLGRRS